MDLNYNSSMYNSIRASMNGGTGDRRFTHSEENESNMIESISLWKQCAQDLYYRSLLNPESHGAKIPSRLPVESAICHLHDTYTFKPNSKGMFLLIFDPFLSVVRLYNSDALDGAGTLGAVTNIPLSQNTQIMELFRLVSACQILQYIGDFNSLKGILVAATNSNFSSTDELYANFSNVEDITSKRIMQLIDGCKMVYSPMDDKATEFYPINTLGPNHVCAKMYQMIIIGYNLPVTEYFRLDFFRNFEYTTVPAFREYILQEKSIPMEYVSPNIVNTISDAKSVVQNTGKQSIWSRMVESAMHGINPVLSGIIQYGLPVLKTLI